MLKLGHEDGKLLLTLPDELSESLFASALYKLRLKRFVDYYDDGVLCFKEDLAYIEYCKIIDLLEQETQFRDWELAVSDSLLQYLETWEFHIQSKYLVGNDIKKRDPRVEQEFADFSEVVKTKMRRPLREKQMRDAFFMSVMGRSSNFSVPGSGKTSAVLGMYAYLKHQGLVKKIVMIGPKNSFGAWIDEYRICFGKLDDREIFNLHDPSYKGSKEKKFTIKYDSGNKELFLFNYESVGSYLEQLKYLVDEKTLLVYDEAHRIKNVQGEYARNSLEVSELAKYTVTMTGTPIPNSYVDIYNNLHLLYGREYKDFFGFSIPLLKDPTEQEILIINEKIKPFFCRTTKKELGVPAANPDEIIPVETTESESLVFRILQAKYQNNLFALLVRILQLESCPNMLLRKLDPDDFRFVLDVTDDEMDLIDFVDYSETIVEEIKGIGITTKMKACVDQAEKLVNEGKPLIIWCIFKESMRLMSELLQQKGIHVLSINGEVEIEVRDRILNDFKNGRVEVLITNPHTLAESISLHTVCHDAIYFEYSFNLVHLLQSKDRIHRLGLESDQYTQYYFMQSVFRGEIGQFSLDEYIYNRLCEKEQTMLEAIDHDVLEHVTSQEEDLRIIFEKLWGMQNGTHF